MEICVFPAKCPYSGVTIIFMYLQEPCEECIELKTSEGAVAISLKAILPRVTVTLPESLKFGPCAVQDSLSLSFHITNTRCMAELSVMFMYVRTYIRGSLALLCMYTYICTIAMLALISPGSAQTAVSPSHQILENSFPKHRVNSPQLSYRSWPGCTGWWQPAATGRRVERRRVLLN